MKVVVYTAAIGETEPVKTPAVIDRAVAYLCFTDRPEQVPEPYEAIPVVQEIDTRMQSRRVKILADHPRLRAAEATLWHDASYRLTRPVSWVARGLRQADLVGLRHPRRSLIEDEAIIIAKYGYLPKQRALDLVIRYRAEGYAGEVMTSGGLLARRVCPLMDAFKACWWQEASTNWGGRDQASLDYAAWLHGVRIRHIHGTIRLNKYADFRPVAVPELEAVC